MDIVAVQSTQGLIALQRRKSATNVVRLATLAVFVEANLLAVVEAMIEVVPNQEGVVMSSQMKLVYALDGYHTPIYSCSLEEKRVQEINTTDLFHISFKLPNEPKTKKNQ